MLYIAALYKRLYLTHRIDFLIREYNRCAVILKEVVIISLKEKQGCVQIRNQIFTEYVQNYRKNMPINIQQMNIDDSITDQNKIKMCSKCSKIH